MTGSKKWVKVNSNFGSFLNIFQSVPLLLNLFFCSLSLVFLFILNYTLYFVLEISCHLGKHEKKSKKYFLNFFQMIPMGTKQREVWTQNNEKYGHKTTKSMDTKQQEVWTQNNEKYGHKTTGNIDTKEILSPLNVHSFQFNHGKARKRCEMVSKITTKTLEQGQRRCFGVFIFNFEHILQLFQSLYWWLQSSKCLLGRPNKLLNCYQVVFQAILFS